MKESIKEILHSDFIEKTKSTFQDMVSGVKSFFRFDGEKNETSAVQHINNHLKSPEEIESEFRLLSINQQKEQSIVITDATVETTSRFSLETMSEELPAYMEENY